MQLPWVKKLSNFKGMAQRSDKKNVTETRRHDNNKKTLLKEDVSLQSNTKSGIENIMLWASLAM